MRKNVTSSVEIKNYVISQVSFNECLNEILLMKIVDHASCSRVHAALLWHKDLNRPFLIDLGSSKNFFTHLHRILFVFV